MTFAPARPKANAVARPIPRLAPSVAYGPGEAGWEYVRRPLGREHTGALRALLAVPKEDGTDATG